MNRRLFLQTIISTVMLVIAKPITTVQARFDNKHDANDIAGIEFPFEFPFEPTPLTGCFVTISNIKSFTFWEKLFARSISR